MSHMSKGLKGACKNCIEKCEKCIDSCQRLTSICGVPNSQKCPLQIGKNVKICRETIQASDDAIRECKSHLKKCNDTDCYKSCNNLIENCQKAINSCEKNIDMCKSDSVECLNSSNKCIIKCQDCAQACQNCIHSMIDK